MNAKNAGTLLCVIIHAVTGTVLCVKVLPPKGFVKIRYYGLLANRNKKTKLELSRKLTCSPTYKPKFEGLKTIDILCILVGRDVTTCPVCQKGKLRSIYSFSPAASP